MFDIKAIDMVLYIKAMRDKADKLGRKADDMETESQAIREQAALLEKQFEDNIKEYDS